MKKIALFWMLFLLVCAVAGCGKKSALEGKVVDGKGKPVAGIKVIAKQVQPIKGYEQFEATTGSDGSFKFAKLFPTSEYELVPYTDKYMAEAGRIMTESGPEGQTKILPAPMELRFSTTNSDVVTDTKTGLMWAKNANIAGSEMNWNQAMGWVRNLNLAGKTGWRLPSKGEWEDFVKIAGEKGKWQENLTKMGFTNVQAGVYWSATEFNDGVAWGVDMEVGGVGSNLSKHVVYFVWPVCSGK